MISFLLPLTANAGCRKQEESAEDGTNLALRAPTLRQFNSY
jgi:hypothetical protein